MSKAASFSKILQDTISPEQAKWDYSVPDLPASRLTNQTRLIKCVSVISSPQKQEITLRYVLAPSNRVTMDEVLDRFVLLSFPDFRLQWPPVAANDALRPATGRENGDWITKMLVSGITINAISYHFFGHSNSQLKSRSCFMYAASKEEVARKIEGMGDLSKLRSVAKKSKRIGLLFSSAEVSTMLPSERCQDIDDVTSKDYIFTDGCGLMSPQFAKLLAQRRNIVFRDKRYLPSVYQIRYRGYKGVLTLDPTLSGQTQVQFRASMRKFKDSPDYSFAVVDYSKPYAFGSLNDEIVVLLHTLGISEKTLLAKQTQHLDFIQNVQGGDPRSAFQFLSYINRTELAEKLLLEGPESVRPTLLSLVKQEYARMINKRDEQRCRILVPKSRLLFGVCDPTAKDGCPGRLKEGECFVRITQDGDGRAQTIINTEVLVTRNPCLHPGDLQKFKVVDIPEFSHLVDCIVFTTQGKRPSADLMSGGDLDGDKFFVTWDSDLVPSTVAEPAQYPGGKELITFGDVTGDSRAEYFARYTNASLGKVKNLYMKWARLGNAMSPQCQQLNRLFSQCVDGNHIRIPQNLKVFKDLEDPPEPKAKVVPFILDVLHEACMQQIKRANILAPEPQDDVDIWDLILTRDKLAISEFELLGYLLRWCDRHKSDIMAYSHAIDFSALTDEQQIWFLAQLPPTRTAPGLVRNGLLQSGLVTPQELWRFGLDHPRLRWKPIFRSSVDRMGRFLPVVCQALEVFHKKLIIMSINDRFSMAIYLPHIIARATEVTVDTNVRVFVFPHTQGSQSSNYRVTPTKVNYRLYCDEHVFQLYQRTRGNTWLFLRGSTGDDALYRAMPSIGDMRRMREKTLLQQVNVDCLASVALDKISRDVQTHFGKVNRDAIQGAEVYVISNRDVASMRVLDQWLSYVDTQEVLPLFEKLELEYTTPKLETVAWDEQPKLVRSICRDGNLQSLSEVNSITDLQGILDLLRKNNEKKRLRDVFAHILLLAADPTYLLDDQTVMSALLRYLQAAPYLTSTFLQSAAWSRHEKVLEDELVFQGPVIASKLILASNELAGFIRHPLSLLLHELKSLSMQDLAALVEFVALTVRTAEAGLDLLLETFEPETSRLIIGRPTAVSQFTSSLIGIALDHIDEAAEASKPEQEAITLVVDEYKDGHTNVKSNVRIDSSTIRSLKGGDHVRLSVTNAPQNDAFTKLFSMDALVLIVESGTVTFKCLHDPPSFLAQCAWTVTHCGSFVTSKTAFDAVTCFYTERELCCDIYGLLLGLPAADEAAPSPIKLPVVRDATLNATQNEALTAAMNHSLTFIWGPPGTGKTHTVIVILSQLLKQLPDARFLIIAPTHNAVDNILRRFVANAASREIGTNPVRVSTQLSKVSPDLRSFTCDAMLGTDLGGNMSARRKAQKRIKDARLIFTTCIGASLGLLRNEKFDVVFVDEASQLTEPATLVPLVKGCSRALLVGDHVQLRATVQKNAILTGYDVSLFERHYNMPAREGVAKVMLDTQYRMHRSICDFSSTEFYEGRLKTAVKDDSRALPPSQFPWPAGDRLVWTECASSEDLGRQSKANAGQTQLCRRIIQLLTTPAVNDGTKVSEPVQSSSIAILTPYTRQRESLSAAIPNIEVSSIDGFQGREADIVVFVTVRCNVSCDVGFLADMRRLNVVMTRARCGVVIIGNASTLSAGIDADELNSTKSVWKRLVNRCRKVTLDSDKQSVK
ncbi:RNA-directed RNA polymerase [Parastagonospora nodorum]|nr:RNA-directed RNA polymerase [Parastagonospora nodorum]KAH6246359.1 RNA-directed RNA polymerase [Parastagonospora nodorum]